MSTQRKVTIVVLVAGSVLLGSEFLFLRWYPNRAQRIAAALLKQLPYRNAMLNLQMQVASGIYGKVVNEANGVMIYRPKWFGKGPSLAITSQPNPTGASQFPDQEVTNLQTAGEKNHIPGYDCEHVLIAQRDAVLISQYDPQSRSTVITARIMAPDRIVQAVCNTGSKNPDVYSHACEESLQSIQLGGPPSKLSASDPAAQ